MKKIYLLAFLALILLCPSKSHAADDVTGLSFEEYEKLVGDLTDGLIYPLVENEIFDEGGNYKVTDPSEIAFDVEGDPIYYDEFSSFYLEGRHGYFVARQRQHYSSLTYKIYGRSGNEAKLLLEVSHPEYVNEFRSFGTCQLYTGDGQDYVSINFSNTWPASDSGQDRSDYQYIYKIGPQGAEKISQLPQNVSAFDYYIVDADNDSGAPDGDRVFYLEKVGFINFYNNNVVGYNQEEYQKFFGGAKEEEIRAFKQAIIPVLSQFSNTGKLDSSLAYSVFQEATANVAREGHNQEGNLFKNLNIFEELEAPFLANSELVYNHYYGSGSENVDKALLESFFRKYYGFSLQDGNYDISSDYGGINIYISDENLEFNFLDYTQSILASPECLAISNVQSKDSYAIMKAGTVRYITAYATDLIDHGEASRYLLVRKDVTEEGTKFTPIYSSQDPISEEDFQRIITEDQAENGPPKKVEAGKNNAEENSTQTKEEKAAGQSKFLPIVVIGLASLCGLGFFLYKNKTKREIKQDDSKISFCNQCGNPVKDDDVFCGKCGNKLK